MLTRISGVHIDLGHADMQFRTLKELRAKENVFDHLPDDQRAASQKLLWDALGGKESEDVVLEEKQPEMMEEIKEG